MEASIFPVPVFAPPLFKGPVASFTDANPDFHDRRLHRPPIDWGDGTPMTAGTISQPGGAGTAFIVSGMHTYADSGVTTGTGTSGTYPIQVFIIDDGGSRLTVTNTANVADNSIVADRPAQSRVRQRPVDRHPQRHQRQAARLLRQVRAALQRHPLGDTASRRRSPSSSARSQAGSDGSWNIKSSIPLADGHYAITATAIDQFGVTIVTTPPSPVVITANLLIDTAGPVDHRHVLQPAQRPG